ncbi:MAG: glucose-6-phosphate dehydrogenase [Chitinivibrionales bacterium]|nr:glucose-6-phosphate dehydrogenase [Chitinivibrionales bacterium]
MPDTIPFSCAIIILGASGDLAQRKLIPALNALFVKNILDPASIVVGAGRSEFTPEQFRSRFTVENGFAARLLYHRTIAGLKQFIAGQGAFKRTIIFMALPPETYARTAAELAAEGLCDCCALVIEKPFGYDEASAAQLNADLHRYYNESQIFRIDHYLGKEAVQNIMVFRFANALFEPLWNDRYIESIQINAAETMGVGNRGTYFDRAGILRDMVQNHLMQLLSLLTMEAPIGLSAAETGQQKIAVLRAAAIQRCFLQQYQGFTIEKGVAPGSATATFAELELAVENGRWGQTRFFIRAGKGLERTGAEIGVTFRPLPQVLFNRAGGLPPNRIIFKIQPAEGIIIDVSSKIPGSDGHVARTAMKFCYRDAFEGEIPEAYQRLLADALAGDHTLFVSAEEAAVSWRLFDPWLDTPLAGTYRRGEAPKSKLGMEWIDFAKYGPLCD